MSRSNDAIIKHVWKYALMSRSNDAIIKICTNVIAASKSGRSRDVQVAILFSTWTSPFELCSSSHSILNLNIAIWTMFTHCVIWTILWSSLNSEKAHLPSRAQFSSKLTILIKVSGRRLALCRLRRCSLGIKNVFPCGICLCLFVRITQNDYHTLVGIIFAIAV